MTCSKEALEGSAFGFIGSEAISDAMEYGLDVIELAISLYYRMYTSLESVLTCIHGSESKCAISVTGYDLK